MAKNLFEAMYKSHKNVCFNSKEFVVNGSQSFISIYQSLGSLHEIREKVCDLSLRGKNDQIVEFPHITSTLIT